MSKDESTPPGMPESEWTKSEAFALRDAGKELDDDNLKREAVEVGQKAVRQAFVENLQSTFRQAGHDVELPPIEDNETLMSYTMRVSELIRKAEEE